MPDYVETPQARTLQGIRTDLEAAFSLAIQQARAAGLARFAEVLDRRRRKVRADADRQQWRLMREGHAKG